MSFSCGLTQPDNYYGAPAFSLESVTLKACVTNLTYNMTAEMKYVNTSSEMSEGKYVFPVSDVAIYYFRATIEDREIICECRPRSEAKSTYDEAIKEGHTAFLSQQDEQCEDMFQISIGNVPAKSSVVILLKYVGHLEAENVKGDVGIHGRVTMTLPQVLNPRYSPNTKVDREYEAFENAVTVHKYKMTLEVTLTMPHEITDVCSLKDKYNVHFSSDDHRVANVTLSEEFIADHDLQICVNLKNELTSCVAVRKGDGSKSGILAMPCLMIQFLVDFTAFTGKCEARTELVFVIDRSGSMAGSNMNYAKDALLLFLKSIPNKCRFQIIGFGSTHDSLFPEPVDYTETSLAKALEYQRCMEADMGGTEVYCAIQTAIESPLTGKNWYREIIFLTDGDVMNPNQVIGLVRSNVNKARLFAVGIGEGASTHLVSGVAKAGRGTSVFLRDGSQLQSAVSKILNTALESRANDVQMEVKVVRKLADGKVEPVEVVVVPKQVPPILPGCFATMYALLKTESVEGIGGTATVKFDIAGQDQTISLDFSRDLNSGCVVESDDQELHRLAGKCQINDLTQEYNALKLPDGESGKEAVEAKQKVLREQVEKLSCQLNILSIFTAHIGVDPKKQDITKVVVQPVVQQRHVSMYSNICSTDASYDCLESCAMPRSAVADSFDDRSISKSSNYAAVGPMFRGSAAVVPQCYAAALSAVTDSVNATTKPRKPRDTFTELVSLQAFNGSWKMEKALADQICIDLKKMEQSVPKEWCVNLTASVGPNVWATALAIAFFEVAFAARRIDWNLIVSKALDWLKEEAEKCGATKQDSENVCKTLIEAAKGFLEQNGVKHAEVK